MSSDCFLSSFIPKEIENTILELLRDDLSSVKALKSVNRASYQWIESGPFFSETDKKAHRAIREVAGINFQLNNLSKAQIKASDLLKTFPFMHIAYVSCSIFSCINEPFDLEKKRLEIAQDFPISHFFGTIEEFNSLPTFTPKTIDFQPEDMPYPIMRYQLPHTAPHFMAEKPALLIRRKIVYPRPFLPMFYCLFYNSAYKEWFYMRKTPKSNFLLSKIGRMNSDEPLYDLKTGKKTVAYNIVKNLIIHRETASGCFFEILE